MSTTRPAVSALVVLDADILYPVRLCDYFLTAGTVSLIAKPVVSNEILLEAQRNVTADRADLGEDRIKGRFDAVRTATSGAATRRRESSPGSSRPAGHGGPLPQPAKDVRRRP